MKKVTRDRRNYDDTRETVACLRPIHTDGQVIGLGEPIPHDITDEPFRRRFWAAGRICYTEEYEPLETQDAPTALTEDEKKALLVERIKELGGKATMGKKLENLEAQLLEYDVDPSSVYAKWETKADDTAPLTEDEEATRVAAESLAELKALAESGNEDAIKQLAELEAAAGSLEGNSETTEGTDESGTSDIEKTEDGDNSDGGDTTETQPTE